MKKQDGSGRTPARRLSREELETGVLAAGCGTQGCAGVVNRYVLVSDPEPFSRLNLKFVSAISTLRFR